jgi:hypothetical protein
MSLYQDLLGDDFSRLPQVLRQFHSHGDIAEGDLTIKCGRGPLRRLLARLLRLPRDGRNVPVRLEVTAVPERETWRRHFAGRELTTSQWREGAHLVEKAGVLEFVVNVEGDERGIYHRFEYNRCCGIRLPHTLSLEVNGHALGDADRWHLEVVISNPLLGMLTTYRGEVRPLP